MRKKRKSAESLWTEQFENLFFATCQDLYRHAKLIFNQEEKAKELLVITYTEMYGRHDQVQKEKVPLDWLLKRMDFLAEARLKATRDMLDAAYAEEKMQSKEAKKEAPASLDEASILLETEDRLGLVDGPDKEHDGGWIRTGLQMLFSVVILAVAVGGICLGVKKVKSMIVDLRDPIVQTLEGVSVQEPEEQEKADGE